MKHIAYLSQATRPLTDQDLQALLAQCRRNNVQLGITGVLFYSHGHIAQLFEGEAAVADALFARIAQDSRHTQVRKLLDRPLAARNFGQWSMAFQPLAPADFATLEGFLLPPQLPPPPTTLHPVDVLLLQLVQQAVFPGAPVGSATPATTFSASASAGLGEHV